MIKPQRNGLEKSEMIYLGLSLLVIIIIGFLTNIQKIQTKIHNLNPIIQFILVNVSLYFIFFVFFKFVVSRKSAIWEASLANFLLVTSMDLILPPYQVTIKGLIDSAIFSKSAIDYFFGYLYSLIGIKGLLLWIFVYPLTFTVLFVLGALLFKDYIKRL